MTPLSRIFAKVGGSAAPGLGPAAAFLAGCAMAVPAAIASNDNANKKITRRIGPVPPPAASVAARTIASPSEAARCRNPASGCGGERAVAPLLAALDLPHRCIRATARQQLGMRAALDDAAVIQHDDLVGVHDRRQP